MVRRYRETDNRVDAPSWDWTGVNVNCSTPSGTIAPDFKVGELSYIRDTVTPAFKRRSREGEVIVNPMFQYYWNRVASPGDWGYTIDGTPCTFSRSHPGAWRSLEYTGGPHDHLRSDDLDLQNLFTLAGTQAQANIQSPEFAGLVALGELRETLMLVKNPLKSWGQFWKRMKSIKNSKSPRDYKRTAAYANKTVLDFVSDNWLTYRYGVRPIVNDINNIVKAVQSLQKAVPKRFTARGKALFSDNVGTDVDVFPTGAGTYHLTGITNRQVSVYAGIIYELDTAPDTFGISLQQIPAALWELITLSFVVDWIANVGTFIEAITPKAGVTVLGSWTTTRSTENSSWTSEWTDGGGRDITGSGLCLEQVQTISTNRVPGIKVGLALKVKPFKGVKGLARSADIAFIARQLLTTAEKSMRSK